MGSHDVAAQYQSDANLRARIDIHRLYTVGPPLEPAIDAALGLSGNESLLDVGTGPGDFPIRLSKSGHRGRIVGIDLSAGMIAKARSAGAGVEFFQADSQALPFPNDTFDVVTARHMLYHVPDIPRALSEARRVLKAGGRFLAVTNTHDNFGEYRAALAEAADQIRGRVADALRILIPVSHAFSEINGPEMVEKVFGNVETMRVDSALRFESAEAPLRYFDSCRTLKGVSIEDWELAREKFAEAIQRRVAKGAWTVSKTAVLILATVSRKSDY
jgi:ubiquinone/menaquinone biosynthesis C-methylase UbiE